MKIYWNLMIVVGFMLNLVVVGYKVYLFINLYYIVF